MELRDQKEVKEKTVTDRFTSIVGEFGKWQLITILVVFSMRLPVGWIPMAILFLTPNFEYKCAEFDSNVTIVAENNQCYDNCLKYEFDTSPFENTIISEFDLVCERRWLGSFTQTVLMSGVLVGSSLFGFLSDRYGRKIMFCITIVILNVFGFAIPFATDYWTFTALRFFLGVSNAGLMVVSFVIIIETIGPKYREIVGCLFQIPFILGYLAVPLFAYYFRTWKSYTMSMAVIPVAYLAYFFVGNESPRWLVSMGKVDEATKIVTKAVKMNKLPTDKIRERLSEMSKEILNEKTEQPKLNYIDLFKNPALGVKSVQLCIVWFVTGFSFYGMNQYIAQATTDPFISATAAAAIQIPANLTAIWLVKYFGRRNTMATFLTLGGVLVLTLGFIPDIFWLKLTLGTFAICCSQIFGSAVYIYCSELFPTVVRNMGMGMCSTCARVGAMIAPFVADASYVALWFPSVVFGVTCIVVGVLICSRMPETGRKLPDSLEDLEKIYKS